MNFTNKFVLFFSFLLLASSIQLTSCNKEEVEVFLRSGTWKAENFNIFNGLNDGNHVSDLTLLPNGDMLSVIKDSVGTVYFTVSGSTAKTINANTDVYVIYVPNTIISQADTSYMKIKHELDHNEMQLTVYGGADTIDEAEENDNIESGPTLYTRQ
jgi:hypothetical protein